ncbi:MAG: rhodanese-like domain-containing protein [Deltaproteobacteria bacterium]|nr:rhodanese-like domain-containing protein [Deltaproteobacteria bacterium]MBW2492848.1 rhodanese-like domain-containing protein [Deltaproteobacteria bacterium]
MDTRQCVIWIIILYLFMLGIVGCAMTPEKSSNAKFRISKEELKDRLDDQNLIILDVRRPQDWKKSGIKIKGAIQENPYKFESWHSRYPKTKTIILY